MVEVFLKKTIWQPISPRDYKRPGVLIFQSCDHDQVSFEIIDLRHGLFTKALLDVWEPKNPNLSFRVLNEKVAARMSELCRENGLDNQRCCLRAEPIEKTDLVIPMWSGIPDTTQPHSFRINYPTDEMSSKQVHKCSGGYNGKWNEGEVWAILRDKYNRFYLQNPPVYFYPDGRWFQNNISCGTNIVALVIVEVGLIGQSIFRDLVNKNFWGAFEPPSDMNILDTISLEPY